MKIRLEYDDSASPETVCEGDTAEADAKDDILQSLGCGVVPERVVRINDDGSETELGCQWDVELVEI